MKTMKKNIYQAPEMMVIKMNTQALMAGSNKAFSVNNGETKTDGWVDSRSFDFDE